MKTIRRHGATLFVSMLFFVLLSALLLLIDIEPPKNPGLVEGAVTNLTPIKTKGNLTGFRFCIGDPIMTFTYSDPDPGVANAWTTIQTSKAVRVQYAVHRHRNPSLWALEADGQSIASTAELQMARVTRFALLLVGACISGVVAVFSLKSWLQFRKVQRDAQPGAPSDSLVVVDRR